MLVINLKIVLLQFCDHQNMKAHFGASFAMLAFSPTFGLQKMD